MGFLDIFSSGRATRPRGIPHNERINALSDGVFAIVIPLLVLELKVPEVEPSELTHELREMLPKFIGHIASFLVLGIYWIGHHNMFMHIQRHDRVLLWLNVLFLMLVASMPFPTGLIVEFTEGQLPLIIFFGTLAAAGVVLDIIWWYATRNRHLVDENIDQALVSFVHRRVLIVPLVYIIGIGVSFASVLAAQLMVIIVALVSIVPNPLDRFHSEQVQSTGQEGE